jgi:cation/acetate symporter
VNLDTPNPTASSATGWPARRWLQAGLLCLWGLVSFVALFFARDLDSTFLGWPLGYWIATQGAILVYVAITVVYAWWMNRREQADAGATGTGAAEEGWNATYRRGLHRIFGLYVVGLLLFLSLLSLAEYWGLSRSWIGAIFLLVTVGLYAAIGIYCRTTLASEYYVAGHRIPAFYNGMATAADWMSAASFISLAGGLYLQGFAGSESQPGGLAYVLGWTGGFCLVALLVAPYLRKRGLYTVPEFFEQRFGGLWPRRIAALATVLCSFTYVVAQIYGVGLITSRLTGVHFEVGILLGLGGVLVCSFLGGMRAVTWTQVAQYAILILAFLIPVSWLAYKQLGNPLAPLVYQKQLGEIDRLERSLANTFSEQSVAQEYMRRARVYEEKLRDVASALAEERTRLTATMATLSRAQGDDQTLVDQAMIQVRRELAALPKDERSAREQWTRAMQENLSRARPLAGMPAHVQPYGGDPQGDAPEREKFESSRLNFLALMFCLMIGTAGMPHLLTRYFTTSSVAETRRSVAWSLVFIALLYLAAPALAVMVKFEIMKHIVGLPFDQLPAWMVQWARIDGSLLSVSDVNGDQFLQFSEMKLGADIVMLATPEIGGLPYVVSGLVAAGGLAAALSTADALLLTIGNALTYDLLRRPAQDHRLSEMRRVVLSKFALLVVALVATYVAVRRPGDILALVSASFSLAGSAFVPVMVLGIFWRRTTRQAAIAGMVTGIAVTAYYMLVNAPVLRAALGWGAPQLWWGIQPISAGVFGVTAGLIVTLAVSLWTGRGTGPQTE